MVLERITLHTKKLSDVLSGLKLVHLSDLHISNLGRRERKLISLVNREQPDIIAITGDLIVHYANKFSACIETLKKLKANIGIFAVFGNSDHTFNSISDFNRFLDALGDIGIIVLNNENYELGIGEKILYIVGVDDPFFLNDNFAEAIEGVPYEAPILLLAHSPDILLSRSDAIVVNLIDSVSKNNHPNGWGWKDGFIYQMGVGDILFENDGLHTLRVQSRQDGVSIDTILLNPYRSVDTMILNGSSDRITNILKDKALSSQYTDLVIMKASEADKRHVHGKWKKKDDPTAISGYSVDDLPDQGIWYFQPLVHPKDYFEVEFPAKRGRKYHVWVRMKANKSSPMSDSVYLQFSDSVDEGGRKRYRIGEEAYSRERMKEVDLILSGHTHGGQVRLPFYGAVKTFTSVGRKYASGLHQIGNTKIYVSRGIGTSVFPIRFLCPPEITVFNFQ